MMDTRRAPNNIKWGEIVSISRVSYNPTETNLFLAIYRGCFTPFIAGSGAHLVIFMPITLPQNARPSTREPMPAQLHVGVRMRCGEYEGTWKSVGCSL